MEFWIFATDRTSQAETDAEKNRDFPCLVKQVPMPNLEPKIAAQPAGKERAVFLCGKRGKTVN